MILSRTAECALRAIAGLATVRFGEPVRAQDLSQATGIPTHYLSKVMRRLVVAGLLVSRKSRGGGFSLAKPPEDIRFIDILTALDADPVGGSCAFGWGECDDDHPCPLHSSWSHLSDQLKEWAEGTTLAEIANTETSPRFVIRSTTSAE